MITVDKDSGIYLYGAASIGAIVYKNLLKNDIRIKGFIDKRADEIQNFCGLPVFEFTNPKILRSDIVFLAVKNVFEHEEIKNMLVQEGYQYIIYKPYNSLLGNGSFEETQLSEWYDELFEGTILNEGQLICVNDLKAESLHDYAVILENDKNVVANIPVEFIFTNNYTEFSPMERWGNIPIQAFFTHINFFRSLNGDKNCSYEDYLTEYCEYTAQIQGDIQITKAWRHNVIRNRTQIFEQMRDSLELEPDFFIRNAATAEWNHKGYFNLTSGKHRSTFLAAMGRRYVPIRISKCDYDLFRNMGAANRVQECLQSAQNKYVCIPHPFFYRGIHSRDDGLSIYMQWIMRTLGMKLYKRFQKVDFSRLQVKDMTNDNGYCARYLARCGCKVYRDVMPDELEQSLNMLFQSNIKYEACDDGDVVIIDGQNNNIRNFEKNNCIYFIRNVRDDDYKYLEQKILGNGQQLYIINNVQHSSGISCFNLCVDNMKE